MINILNKAKCCGCSACFNICPENAITMEYDSEGFLYPKIDNAKCTKCGLCLKVCPIINNKKDNKVLEVYAAKNKNIEEQLKSSSGGIFSIFANYVLGQKGIVFGASFDSNWKIVHKYIDKKEDLDSLRRSKYVQSDINITYKQVKQFLDNDRLVLFTGTPCQIAGLKSYLPKNYENLISIDLICLQVGSPLVFQKSLNDNINDIKNIKHIDFREKAYGWDNSRMLIILKDDTYSSQIIRYRDGYMAGLFSRPACHKCYFKGNRNSDFTIGDLWGINKIVPEMYDKKGVSVLTLNSQKAKQIFELIKDDILYRKIQFLDVIKNNPAFAISAKPHIKRNEFFERYKTENVNKLIVTLLKNSI